MKAQVLGGPPFQASSLNLGDVAIHGMKPLDAFFPLRPSVFPIK